MQMDIFVVLILSIVEGITEFIPISSTGHMILVGEALNFTGEKAASFEIFIQVGAIGAVVWLYRERFSSYLKPTSWTNTRKLNFIHFALAIFPVVVLGALAYKTIKHVLFSSEVVAISLIVGGLVMIIVEKWGKLPESTTSLDEVSYLQAFKIGCLQCFALIPGVSRSGATILGGLFFGLNYKTAAEFSFLIAVPVMLMASGYDLLKSAEIISRSDMSYFLLGAGLSFIVAYFSIKTFLKLLSQLKLTPFGWYRILIGIVVLTRGV